LTHLREPAGDPGGRGDGGGESGVKFGNFLFPDSRDLERDGAVIDETLREAWLSDELGVDVIWLAEHHFDGI
jgi:alkanesulfonate monooxygenase SsuD/methylene tetrahydromethanopterin reductase-like flavin-dependent oxidoreductase (luciferase family)